MDLSLTLLHIYLVSYIKGGDIVENVCKFIPNDSRKHVVFTEKYFHKTIIFYYGN